MRGQPLLSGRRNYLGDTKRCRAVISLCAAVLATLVTAAAASAQAPAYTPPAWFIEGVELVKQQAPAADCEPKYSGDSWILDYQACAFFGRPVSGAVANGRCSAYGASNEVSYTCLVWFGPVAEHSCSRFSSPDLDAWRGGEYKPDKPYTSHAELTDCLDSESPGPQDVSKLSGKRSQSAGSSVAVDVTCTQRCTAGATGKLTIAGASQSFKLKAKTKTIEAYAHATLKLVVSKQARNAARRALKTNKQVRAKLAVTVVDGVGTRRVKHRTVKIRL